MLLFKRPIIITDDFYFKIDDCSDKFAMSFLDICSTYGPSEHVREPCIDAVIVWLLYYATTYILPTLLCALVLRPTTTTFLVALKVWLFLVFQLISHRILA